MGFIAHFVDRPRRRLAPLVTRFARTLPATTA
jgi:hypothetical protein